MLDFNLFLIKTINTQLCSLCELPYTDFYETDNFVRLFELSVENCVVDSLNEILRTFGYNRFWNKITFIQSVAECIEDKKDNILIKKTVKAIRREFS